MNLKPEERKIAIRLGSLTAAVFVVGGFNIYRQTHRTAPGYATTVTPASETTPNVAASSGAYSGNQNLSAPATSPPTEAKGERDGRMDMYADNLPEAKISRDPFMRIEAESDPDASSAARFHPNTAPVNLHPNGTVEQTNPTVLPGDMTARHTMPDGLNTHRQAVQTAVAAQMQMEDLMLAGVIAGPSSVAVIHIGDHSYQLGDGEKLPNNMSLVRVTDTGVYLKQGSKLLFLEIGKTLRSAMQMKTNILLQSSTPSSDPGGTLLSSEPAPSHSEAPPEREEPTQVTVNTPGDN
jgi:hypothetical protein